MLSLCVCMCVSPVSSVSLMTAIIAVSDTGLTQADVTKMTTEHAATRTAVLDAVVQHGGFAWPLLASRSASLDLADPRPPAKCAAYLRSQCKPGAMTNKTLMFEFTREKFHDSFPLPHVTEDVAQFLLVRQEYAYIGYSWMGCIQPDGFVQVSIAGLLLHHSEDSQMTRSRAGQRYRVGRVPKA